MAKFVPSADKWSCSVVRFMNSLINIIDDIRVHRGRSDEIVWIVVEVPLVGVRILDISNF